MQTREELLQHKEIDDGMLGTAYDKAAELIKKSDRSVYGTISSGGQCK